MRKTALALAFILVFATMVDFIPALALPTASSAPPTVAQLGVWAGDHFIPATPIIEAVTTGPALAPFSLLPLEGAQFSLDLRHLTPPELSMLRLHLIFDEVYLGDTVLGPYAIWLRKRGLHAPDTGYLRLPVDGHLNLYLGGHWNPYSFLELLVGDGNQLNPDNLRFRIHLQLAQSQDPYWLGAHFRTAGGESRALTPFNQSRGHWWPYDLPQWLFDVCDQEILHGDAIYLGLRDALGLWEAGGAEVSVFQGAFATVEETLAQGTPITHQIWSQARFGPVTVGQTHGFTFIIRRDGVVTGHYPFGLQVRALPRTTGFSICNVFATYGPSWRSVPILRTEADNVLTARMGIDPSQDGYISVCVHFRLNGRNRKADHFFEDEDGNWVHYIQFAALGHLDTAAQLRAQPNIASELFGWGRGFLYEGNFAGAGQDFTMLDYAGNLHHFTIRFVFDPSVPVYHTASGLVPRPGQLDNWFRITGASGVSPAFVMPFQHDTYYAYGFQTVLVLEADLTSLAPVFWHSNAVESVTVNGQPQVSGKTRHDFSRGPVQYTVTYRDGAQRHFWVSFVRQHPGGAGLFVNGLNGPGGVQRRVYLDSLHSNLHDIFIASVGDAPLTGLTATLVDPVNVRLCTYWTVGGAHNNRLAAFDRIRFGSEQDNIAKVRLLPGGTDDANEGEVSGTLVLRANGIAPLEITLTGASGNPALVTQSLLPRAIEGFPFAMHIRYRNVHAWNEVSLNLVAGSLPQGMTLQGGLLSGTPQQAGVFHFTVQMLNSAPGLPNMTRGFTLHVLENTAENIDALTDPGFEVLTALPARITAAQDQAFVSAGAYGEFWYLWINAERLERGVHFDAEPGSTVITVRAQTFAGLPSGRNTLIAEFREGGVATGALRRSAQSFEVQLAAASPGGNLGGFRGVSAMPMTRREAATSAFLPVAETHPAIAQALEDGQSVVRFVLPSGIHGVRMQGSDIRYLAQAQAYLALQSGPATLTLTPAQLSAWNLPADSIVTVTAVARPFGEVFTGHLPPNMLADMLVEVGATVDAAWLSGGASLAIDAAPREAVYGVLYYSATGESFRSVLVEGGWEGGRFVMPVHSDGFYGLMHFPLAVVPVLYVPTLEPAPTPPAAGIQLRFLIDSAAYTHNGAPRLAEAPIFIDAVYDRTMVPLRVVVEALGATVTWDDATRTATILRNGVTLLLPIDAPLPGGMGMPAIVNDRTFVPLAYVSETLGATVRWDGAARAVYVTE